MVAATVRLIAVHKTAVTMVRIDVEAELLGSATAVHETAVTMVRIDMEAGLLGWKPEALAVEVVVREARTAVVMVLAEMAVEAWAAQKRSTLRILRSDKSSSRCAPMSR